jgi:hypothetical protein
MKLRFRYAAVLATISALVLVGLAAVGASLAPAGTKAPSASEQYHKRVTVCHRSGKKLKRSKYRTIRIPPRALRGHLRHGDGLGACPRARFTICHKTKASKRRTMAVRGSKAHLKHMKHGDKIRACRKAKKKKK